MSTNPVKSDSMLEAQVLATILRDPNAMLDLPQGFDSGAFLEPVFKATYLACLRVLQRGDMPTYVAVRKEHERAGMGSGDMMLVQALSENTGLRASEFVQAAGQLAESSRRRNLWDAGHRLTMLAADERRPIAQVESEHEQDLAALDTAVAPDTVSVQESAEEWERRARAMVEGNEEPSLDIGIPALQEHLSVNKTDLLLVGGRPANGKSVLALQIARYVAKSGVVMFAGLEMHRSENHIRILRAMTGLRREDVVKPPNVDVFMKVQRANEEAKKLHLEWEESPDLDVILRAGARLKRKRGLALVVVDYIQRVRLPWGKQQNRDQALGDAAQRLKDFAAEHEVPVLAVAALSRESARRDDPRPRLEDLRESGRLEYEANSVVFVHVPAMCPNTQENKTAGDPSAPHAAREDARRTVEIMVAKQRDGESAAIVEAVHEYEFSRVFFRQPVSERRYGT